MSDLSAGIDGRPLNNLDAYRAESPVFRWGPLPADNALGAPEGTESDAVAAGSFLLLPAAQCGGARDHHPRSHRQFRPRGRYQNHGHREAARALTPAALFLDGYCILRA